MVFFEIAALHSLQLGLKSKPLVTTNDFNNLSSKNVALSTTTCDNIYKKIKFFAGAFQEFQQKLSKYLFSRKLFVDCFCYKERIAEKKA